MAQNTTFTQTPKGEPQAPPEQPKPVAGKKLPEGFANPPRGQMGHLCVGPKGEYQPKWYQLLLRRPEGAAAEMEYFQLNDEKYYVPYNKWVDVPPSIVTLLQDARIDVLQPNVNQATGDYEGDLSKPGEAMKIIDSIPAFAYTLLPSA